MIRGLMPLGVAQNGYTKPLARLIGDSWLDAVRRCSVRTICTVLLGSNGDSWRDVIRRCSKRSPTGLRWSAIAT
ncbi:MULTISPECIES: hypothetical protein [Calothrix]|uniref:Transposase n=2 Tax=Calothrix TaxID=1186 RepID=A0ABR8AMB0_9CYAN|nr:MULTISPECIES: hypothetical protein [Calothrix]MBD2200685.1 hypothetical protein [Calothrix parietina FACHB-288]MBD2229734.1 hypothetical protein [Calothrix anomala FACHB-343]